ncbi:MAG: pimeloyl-ACP methyl ester carboxylesterase [Bacteroidia bacterium]|jgi:pimeloyl-ACP methyl ester carboxylesterase
MNKILTILIIALTVISCGDASIKQGDVLYLRNKGADMPAYVYGNITSNTFMILLHGGPGGNGLEYRGGQYVEDLEKEIAVVYWDQRGQGNSRGNKHDETLNMDLLLDDLDQLVLLLKHQYGADINLFLYGHSWGGTYGTKYMMSEKRQSQFNGWIESNGAHDIPKLNKEAIKMFIAIGQEEFDKGNHTTDWKEILDFANGVDTLNISDDEGGTINQHGHKAGGLIDALKTAGDDEFKMPLRNPTDMISSSIAGGKTANTLMANGIEDIALTDSLYKIKTPTLLLWGKYDFVVPPQLGYDAEALIGTTDKELIIYEFSDHSPMNGEGAVYAADILRFINNHLK